MNDNFSNVEQRVMRYWYSDGIGELIGGMMFILLGFYFAAQELNSFVSALLQSSLLLLMVGGSFISRRLVNALKTRLTYPRTGYVEYQVNENQMKWRRIWVIALAFAISALSMVFIKTVQIIDSMVAVTGVAVGLILIFLRAKAAGLMRFYLLGGISLVLGLALSVSGLPNGYSLGLFYGLMGVSFLLTGGITLGRYLHQNPLPESGHDE
jgi:hypothetical protein